MGQKGTACCNSRGMSRRGSKRTCPQPVAVRAKPMNVSSGRLEQRRSTGVPSGAGSLIVEYPITSRTGCAAAQLAPLARQIGQSTARKRDTTALPAAMNERRVMSIPAPARRLETLTHDHPRGVIGAPVQATSMSDGDAPERSQAEGECFWDAREGGLGAQTCQQRRQSRRQPSELRDDSATRGRIPPLNEKIFEWHLGASERGAEALHNQWHRASAGAWRKHRGAQHTRP